MKYKKYICINAYLHNLCKLVIFFITIKNMDMMNYIIWKYFYQKKTWRNPVISHDFRWKSQFFPQNSSNICIFNFFFFLNNILLDKLTCFTTVPIFESIGPLVAEIWGGPKQPPPPPPPPMDSSPQNNPMGLGLIQGGYKASFTSP